MTDALFASNVSSKNKIRPMNKQKTLYLKPRVDWMCLELEAGIAVGSAILSPGNSEKPLVPEMEEWTDTGSQTDDFDVL